MAELHRIWLKDELAAVFSQWSRHNGGANASQFVRYLAQRVKELEAENTRLRQTATTRPAPRPTAAPSTGGGSGWMIRQRDADRKAEAERDWNVLAMVRETMDALEQLRDQQGGYWNQNNLAQLAAGAVEDRVNEWWDEIRAELDTMATEKANALIQEWRRYGG